MKRTHIAALLAIVIAIPAAATGAFLSSNAQPCFIAGNTSYRILKQRVFAQRGYAAQLDKYVGMELNNPEIDFVGLARSLGVPADRARALQDAFLAAHRDPQFLAEGDKRQLYTDYVDAAGTRKPYDAAIALGCVIRGDTIHFEIVSIESSRALMELSVNRRLPLGNGIITVNTDAQAWARARASELNKGGDAARAALAMLRIKRRLTKA